MKRLIWLISMRQILAQMCSASSGAQDACGTRPLRAHGQAREVKLTGIGADG
jgi:hypothetical protein